MANLKADSPLCRRIVLSFLDFLNSVEPTSASDVESLEVAKDCLSEAFKIDPSSTGNVAKSDSLVEIFSSKTGQNEIKSDQIHDNSRVDTSHASCTNNAVDTKTSGASPCQDGIDKRDTRTIGVHGDELFGQFFGALEKVRYFGANGDDEQALDRATQLFHNVLTEMKKSGCEEIDLKKLADGFKLQGNKAMQSKVYSEAIELYTVAIALCDDNAVYYCNRAAAYTQTYRYTEAIHDCNKAIAIDPNYSKAYSRLGFTYYAQGNYKDAIEKGFRKALELDPNNESVRGNIQAAEQKLREEQQRAERNQNSRSGSNSNQDHSGESSRTVPPLPFNNGSPFDLSSIIRGMAQGNSNEPEIRVREIVGEGTASVDRVFGALRSVMQGFSDGTPPSQDNSNGS